MGNRIQFKRTTTQATPPASLSAGEPAVVLDTAGQALFYVGDQNGDPVLINPAPSPVGGLNFDYDWDNDQTVSDPGAGNIKLNGDQDPAANPGTKISVNDETENGNDVGFLWDTVKPGDYLGLIEQGGGANAGGEGFYFLVSTIVDQGGWREIDGTVIGYTGNDIDNNRRTTVLVIPDPNPAAGTGDLTSTPGAGDNTVQPTGDHAAMKFRQNAAQTNDLVEFQDDGGTKLTSIDADGNPDGMTIDAGTFP